MGFFACKPAARMKYSVVAQGRRSACKVLLMASLFAGACPTWAQAPLNIALREQIVTVPKGSGLTLLELEATLFKPPGAGPFPVVVLNHGKSPGDAHFQDRARYEAQVREFVQRDYLVIIPMRQGFSKSGGSYMASGCNVEGNGRSQAQDVLATLQYLKTVPEADLSRVLVAGQSHGGLTTMAFGELAYPGVQGLINFAGGLRQENCAGWESGLASAMGAFGRKTTVPSLWFYGDNDSYWQPWLYREMHQRYTESGARARLVAYGAFGSDAHAMFSSRAGLAIWVPEVERFLVELGLPSQKRHQIALMAHAQAVPAATAWAAREDDKAVPFVGQTGRDGYLKFLELDAPKAFAISPKGVWSYIWGRANAMTVALERCNQRAKEPSCRLYAVDDHVVWNKE